MPVTVNTPMPESVRRIEVITGDVGRRKWTDEQKASIVAECLFPGRTVSSVARAHGMSASQLFGWRRQLRDHSLVGDAVLAFVPAVVEARPVNRHGERPLARRKGRHASVVPQSAKTTERSSERAAIVIELGSTIVRIGESADASTVAAVIAALRGQV